MALPFNVDKPSVAASYLQLLVEIVVERGFREADLMQGLPIPRALLEQPGGRLSPLQWGLAVNRAMVLCKDPGLGYECGLRMRPTVNGYLGYAVMSSPSLAEAMNLLTRYIESRQRAFSIRIANRAGDTRVELRQNHAIPVLRSFFYEHILIGIARGAAFTLGQDLNAAPLRSLEVWFEWPEPAYFAAYRDRLPTVRFAAPANLLRIPAEVLALVPVMADQQAARQAIEQCERELAQLGGEGDSMTARVCAELRLVPQAGYPTQAALARRLHVSARTLARQLGAEGASYRELLEHTRQRDACQLLEGSPMGIGEIAAHLGYQNPANFTRAFRQWTGQSPSQYRIDCARAMNRTG